MQTLYNHSGELIAYHYQNMLIHPENMEVMGLVLGNCVYDRQAKVLGKLFQQQVHNIEGEIIAGQSDISSPLPQGFNITRCILQAWHILVKVKDHSGPWVKAGTNWARTSLAELLYTTEPAYA